MAYVNLENHDTRQFAVNDPRGFLKGLPDGVILDEIQRVPDLTSYIQSAVDENPSPGQFILTGSQQFEVSQSVNQSLAGRTALLKLLPLSIEELGKKYLPSSIDRLMLNGFFPRIYDRALDPVQALGDYFETCVERDLRQLISLRDLRLFEKFVKLCAGRIGQILNLQSLANDTGISHTTSRSWLSLLEASFVVFVLPPFFRNVSRRLIKSPKLFFFDVGMACNLLGLETENQVSRDPLRGNIFENLCVLEVLKYRFHRGKKSNLYFYRDAKGHEIDLVLEYGRELFPIEIKAGATINPDFFKGFGVFEKLFLDRPWGSGLIYGGQGKQVRSLCKVFPVQEISQLLSGLRETDGS